MHEKQVISTDMAPKPIGCYSQAIKMGNTVYVSGQIGFDLVTCSLAPSLEEQTRLMFQHLLNIVKASGGSVSNIVKVNVYLTDMAYFTQVNTIMSEFFTEPYPARAAIGVKELPKGALVEADCIAIA